MLDINVGMVELLMFGAFILGSYIKSKIDNQAKNKTMNDLFQCSVHLGIALYTIYNINNNNAFNTNLLQETNKMFSHYGKNFGDMVNQVKIKLEEYSDKNEKIIELYKKVMDDMKDTVQAGPDAKSVNENSSPQTMFMNQNNSMFQNQ
jgi:hypothetical protein